MASIVDESNSTARTYRWARAWSAWIVRRRIAISLIGFSALIVHNVAVRQTIPLNPFSFQHPAVWLSWALLLLGLAIRSWAAGTLDKSRSLTTIGPYAACRNPLYAGSFLMMLAFCILSRDGPTMAFICGPLALVYWAQIRHEENWLRGLFPDQWPQYQAAVPRLFPRPAPLQRLLSGWSVAEWKRNREYRAVLATAVGIVAIYGWFLMRTAV